MALEIPKPKLSRVQKIVLPILRAALPSEVEVTSWFADIDYRNYPFVNVRRLGGIRNPGKPHLLATPVIEMTAYTDTDLIDCENLYDTALEALYDAQRKQVVTPDGYLHSVFETMGATQFSSGFQSTWRVQGLIQLGIRPPR